ncbi:MAG: head GIN domain-containing protein [Mariniphaga sp.]
MKSRVFTLLVILIFAGSQSLVAQSTQTRTVSAFTEISLKIGANVFLKQGNTQSVEVKGDEATLNRLMTTVNDRKLVIKYPSDTWFSSWNPGKVDVYITIPQIDELVISGSGSIVAEGKINSRILNLLLSGSGDMKLPDLEAEKVIATLSGSGNIQISGNGTAAEFKGTISGSGNIKAIDFPANDVNVKIGGSGNCWVNSIKNLVAKIGGSGNVIYRGNPLVDTAILGSGNVKKE